MNKIPDYKSLKTLLSEIIENDSLNKDSDLFSIRSLLYDKKIMVETKIRKQQKLLAQIDFLINTFDNEFESHSTNIVSEPVEIYNLSSSNKGLDSDLRNKEFWRNYSIDILSESRTIMKSSDIIKASNVSLDKNTRRACMSILSIVLAELVDFDKVVRYKIDGEKGFYYAIKGIPFVKPKKM